MNHDTRFTNPLSNNVIYWDAYKVTITDEEEGENGSQRATLSLSLLLLTALRNRNPPDEGESKP